MKKRIVPFLIVVVSFFFVACNNTPTSENKSSSDKASIEMPPGVPGKTTDTTERTLNKHWNLSSFPVEKATPLSTLMESGGQYSQIQSIWKWDTSQGNGGEWLVYPATRNFGTLATILPDDGYWIRTRNGFEFAGAGVSENTYTFAEGWNLLGYSHSASSNTVVDFFTNGDFWKDSCVSGSPLAQVWSWQADAWKVYFPNDVDRIAYNQANNTSFEALEILEAGMGIWVKANEANLPPSTGDNCSSNVMFEDGLADFDKMLDQTGGLGTDSGEENNRFQGDLDRLKRSTNEEEWVEYLMPGQLKSISFTGYYWEGDKPAEAPFKASLSKTGLEADYNDVTLIQTQVGEANDGWIKIAFEASGLAEDQDYVRIIFPIISSDANVWHPQLGHVQLQYEEKSLTDDNQKDGSVVVYDPIAGGQAPLLVPEETKNLMFNTAGITTQFDYFVTRGLNENSNKLFENGDKEYRFVSFNLPNLNITEDPYWGIKNEFETEDGLKTIAAMGGRVTRTYVLSVFNADSPTRLPVHVNMNANNDLVFDEDLFVAMDKMLAYANKHGVRVIIPFVDRSNWWGGVNHLAAFRGKTGAEFYTDPQVKQDYKDIVSYVLNRVNTITGVAYKDDPAVFAWETGNELRSVTDEWTMEMAAFIKGIDSKHLLMDGKEVNLSEESLNSPNVDIITNHYYGGGYKARFLADWKTVALRKPFIVGETGLVTDLTDTQSIVESVVEKGATGIMLWSLRTQDAYGGFRDHLDDPHHAYHWPGFAENETAYGEQTTFAFMWENAYAINGEVKPDLPAPWGTPVLLPISTTSDIRWKGSTSAQYYDIERTETPEDANSWVLVGDNVIVGGTGEEHWFYTDRTDWMGTVHQNVRTQLLFQDSSAQAGKTYHYRVKGINSSGETAWSNVESILSVGFTDGIFEDTLDTLDKASAFLDKDNLAIDSGNSEFFGETQDAGRAKHGANNEDYLLYGFGGEINSFWLETYLWRGGNEGSTANFKVQLSTDGTSWDDFPSYAASIGQIGDWEQVSLTGIAISEGYTQLRVVFPIAVDWENSWAQQLGNVKIGVGNLALNIPANRKLAPKMTTIDNFESYASTSELTGVWSSYIALTPSLNSTGQGNNVKLDYDFDGNGYSGFENVFKDNTGSAVTYDWSDATAIKFWVDPDGSDNLLVLQFKEAGGDVWEAYTRLNIIDPQEVTILLSDFHMPHWGSTPDQVLDKERIEFFKIFLNQSISGVENNSTTETGTLFLDDFELIAQ